MGGIFNPRKGTPAWYKAPYAYQVASAGRSFTLGGRKRSTLLAKRRRFAYTRGVAPEIKYLDTKPITNGATTIGGYVFNVNSIAEGTDFNNRVGRLIHMRYVQLDLVCFPPNTGVQDSGVVHLVYDKVSNATAPAYGDIFDTTIIDPAQAFKNIAKNADRFKVIRSIHVGPLDHTAALEGGVQRYVIKLPFSCSKSRYAASAAAIPDTGALYCCIASFDNNANLATGINWNIACRCAFNDA